VEVGEVETLEVMVKVNVVRKPRTQKALADSVKALIQIPVKQHNDFQDQLPGIQAMIDWNNVEKKNTKIYPTVIGLPVYARVIAIDTLSYKID
jgi:hypothetical protein